MGDHDDAFGLRQLTDILHNDGFALNINVARCLVKNVNVLVGNKAHGQRQTLLLLAGDVGRILGNNFVKPAVLLQEGEQVDLFKCGTDFLIGDLRLGKPEVCPHRFIENIGVVADNGEMGIVRCAGKALQFFSADCDNTGIRAERAEQKVHNGGFAAAGLAHQGGHAVAGEGHRHIFKDIPLAIIGEGDTLKLQLGIRHSLLPPDRVVLPEKGENFLPRRDTVHGNMER